MSDDDDEFKDCLDEEFQDAEGEEYNEDQDPQIQMTEEEKAAYDRTGDDDFDMEEPD